MGNTVYLNDHFTPKNQTSYYHSNLHEWRMRQEEKSNLLLEKVRKQHQIMHQQYRQILYAISNNNEKYEDLKEDLSTLQKFTRQNINLTNMTQQMVLDVVHTLEPFTKTVRDALQENEQSNHLVKEHQALLKQKIQQLENEFMHIEQLGKTLYQGQQNMVEQFVQKQTDLKSDFVLALEKTREQLEENTVERLSGELDDLQIHIVNNLFASIKEVKDEIEQYVKASMKEPLHDLLKTLTPGTKMNKIIIAGVAVEVHAFIHYDQTTKQVKWMKENKNLIITNCADIQAIEIKTRKQAEDS